MTLALAQEFERVIGIDASVAQLQHAVLGPNITYRQASAEATGIADGTVALVTAATSLHW